MAITRTQIAKQLLAEGGRTGYRVGGQGGRAAEGPVERPGGPSGDTSREDRRGGQYTSPEARTTNRERGRDQSLLEAQRRADLRKAVELFEEEKKQEKLERFRKLNDPKRRIEKFASRFSPIAMFASKFGPLNTRDFFVENFLTSRNAPITPGQFANLTEEEKETMFDDYVSARNRGEIDAYGNQIDRDNRGGGINQIIPVDTTFAQAPSITEQEPEEEDEGLRLAFRANGGRIGAQEGGIMPRLNQLGSGVSSAEQTLQDINQRLESAESSLGGSGGNQFSQVTLPATLIEARRPGGGNQMPAGFGTRPNLNVTIDPSVAKDLADQPLQGVFNNGFNFRQPGDMGRYVADNDPGGIMAGYSSYQDYLNAGNDPVSRPQGPQPLSAQGVLGIPAAGYADGGNVVGGEFDFESARQMYGLGKLVKKVTRTVKKIAKSPVGKAAIAAATIKFGGQGLARIFPTTFGSTAKSPFLRAIGRGQFFGDTGIFSAGKTALFGSNAIGPNVPEGLFSKFPGGGVGAAIVGTSIAAGLLTPKQEEEAQALAAEEGIDIEAARNSILARAQGNTRDDFRATVFRAEGGRIGYQEGSKEPVAKKTMPLLDLDGKEMDLREEGGFVPIGRMEKADDVPARLSKNEFVFTADAVRNAGEGDVDKGAEVMYNMMKNLEAGGEVSEESQGLEGARKMFQTSQRLEEVL